MTNLTMETSISATQDARPDIHQALRSTPTHNECAPSEMPGFNLDDYHSPTDYNPWEADFDFLVPDLDNSTTELTRDLLTVIPGQSSHIENVLGGTPMFLSPPSNSNVPQTVHCTS
jgi:hypothetical protein